MSERLAARTSNPYGKARGDMDRILADLAAVEPQLRKAADHEIRTTIPARRRGGEGTAPDMHISR
jgi:hypothetical protein